MNKIIQFFTILICAQWSCCIVNATPVLQKNQHLNEVYEDLIYTETLNNCMAIVQKDSNLISLIFNNDAKSGLLVSIGQTLEHLVEADSEIKSVLEYFIKNKGHGIYTKDRIESPGFFKALHECFPDNMGHQKLLFTGKQLREIYQQSMIISGDVIGKIPIIFETLVVLKSIWMSKSVIGWIQQTMPRVGQLFINATAIVFGTATVHYTIEEYQKKQKELMEPLTAQENENVSMHVSNLEAQYEEIVRFNLERTQLLLNELLNKLKDENNQERGEQIQRDIDFLQQEISRLNIILKK